MFEPNHRGLILDDELIANARSQRDKEPVNAAWDLLQTAQTDDPLVTLQRDSLRYCFDENVDAGARGVAALQNLLTDPDDGADSVQYARQTFALAQCFEMLRNHSACLPDIRDRFVDWLSDRTSAVEQSPDSATTIEQLWQAVVYVAAGIVTEDEVRFEQGTAIFRSMVNDEIHPEGYLVNAVEFPEVQSFRNQLLGVQALTLIAEMGTRSGVDLWAYQSRSVSVLTAATYPLYYYFYPEQWPWNGDPWKPSEGVELDVAQTMFREHAGFLELARPRYERPLKALGMILDELRPVYDVYGGTVVTLAFAASKKKKRRGLFG